MAAAGYGLLYAAHGATKPIDAADVQASASQAHAGSPAAAAPVSPTQDGAAELLATAISPEPAPAGEAAKIKPAAARTASKPLQTASLTPVSPAPAPPATLAAAAAANASPKLLYSAAVRQIEGGDSTGVEALRRAANLGYAPAQFYLAKLHETGSAGVKKDPAEARRWTERAAASGDPKAMHNLALYYFEGTGGAKNTTVAASWFKRAADAGLEDSQYNLARLYEQGYGVSQNAAEAYKWYLIAAAAGDTEAKTSAERLRAQLTPEAQTAAQRSATGFRAQVIAPVTTAAAQ